MPAPFQKLGALFNSPLTLAPIQRSMLAQALLQQSQRPSGVVSPAGTANKVLQGILARRQANAEREQQNLTSDRQAALAGALSRSTQTDPYKSEAARRAAMIISGGLPDDPLAQSILSTQAKNALSPAGEDPFTLSPGQTRYDASGKPIVTAPAAPDRGKPIPDLVNEISDDLYKESTDYVVQLGSMGRIQQSASDPSAAGDMALIFNYMKLLDPNSVVREAEYATAENARGVPATIRNVWNRLLSGERLEGEQRQDFLDRSQRLFKQASADQGERNKRFLTRATSLGVPKDIFEPLLIPLAPAALAPAQPTTSTAPQVPASSGPVRRVIR